MNTDSSQNLNEILIQKITIAFSQAGRTKLHELHCTLNSLWLSIPCKSPTDCKKCINHESCEILRILTSAAIDAEVSTQINA